MGCPYYREDLGRIERYADQLELWKLLKSIELRTYVHDEHLFILTHQTMEIWFNYLIRAIDSIREIFTKPIFQQKDMLIVNSRLRRICAILKHLCDQIAILETMNSNEFLDFKEAIGEEKFEGFYSSQFEILQNKLGVTQEILDSENASQNRVSRAKDNSLFHLINKWLENTINIKDPNFTFPTQYRKSSSSFLQNKNQDFKERFERIFDAADYKRIDFDGATKPSHKAFWTALLVNCYKDENCFEEEYSTITLLSEVDKNLQKLTESYRNMMHQFTGKDNDCYLNSIRKDGNCKAFDGLAMVIKYLLPQKYIPRFNEVITC